MINPGGKNKKECRKRSHFDICDDQKGHVELPLEISKKLQKFL
jgi:hypothetical protein